MKTTLMRPVPEGKPYTIPFDSNAQNMMVGAACYAMGRRSYVVSMTVDWTIPLLPHCKDVSLLRMLNDLEINEDEIASSDDCDRRDWQRLHAAILEEQRERTAHKRQKKEPFTIPFDRDTQDIFISYVRGAMGGRAGRTDRAVEYAIPLLPHCEDRVLRVLMSDFLFYEARIARMPAVYIQYWKRLKAAIVEERVRRADR